jgi:hypothetical protein
MRGVCLSRHGRTEHIDAEAVRSRIANTSNSSSSSVNDDTTTAVGMIGGREGRGGRSGALQGDVVIPGGEYMLGGVPSQPWLFDAERYAHPVRKKRPFLRHFI